MLVYLTIFQFILQLDNYEIRKGKNLKCNISVANLRLFVGNIPKSKSKDEIVEEFSKITGNTTFAKAVTVDNLCQSRSF